MEYLIGILVVAVVAAAAKVYLRRITIFEYERGLKYGKGRFRGVLQPGQYWFMPFFTTVIKIDIRPVTISIPGQEVLSSDSVTLKVSLAVTYEIADPNVAINQAQNYQDALYVELQLAAREIIGNAMIDELLEKRTDFAGRLRSLAEPKAERLGLKLLAADLKGIMFPGKLKEIFAQVVKARKEGLAALERARGETAALRNLANAAKMAEKSPALMQLRLIQAVGESSGNSIVLGMPPQTAPIPVKAGETNAAGADSPDSEAAGDGSAG